MALYEVGSDGTLKKVAGGLGLRYDTVSTSAQTVNAILDTIYPIGSIRLSINPNETNFLGGTWVKIMDSFIVGAGNTYNVGDTGGEATHTLTEQEIPSHRHTISNPTSNTGANEVMNPSTNGTGPFSGDSWGWRPTGYTGGGQAHNNLPPYIAVFIYKRTA